jgi:hypothetical protein
MTSTTQPNAVEETASHSVRFMIEVEVDLEQAADFAEALTGNDDDIVLAAETAIRERLAESSDRLSENDPYGLFEHVQLSVRHEKIVKRFLAEAMGPRRGGSDA